MTPGEHHVQRSGPGIRRGNGAEHPFRPLDTPAFREALSRFNARWSERHRVFLRCAPRGASRSASRTSADGIERSAWAAFLPIEEYLGDLSLPALLLLPHPSWLPGPLRARECHPLPCRPSGLPDTIPGFLAAHGRSAAGPLTWRPEELPRLLCSLADPASHGTSPGRYPQQVEAIRERLQRPPFGTPSVLDLACGTGHGTYELAASCRSATGRSPTVIGMTLEPLEAWMATARRLPHDPRREASLRELPAAAGIHFLAGDVRHVPARGPFAAITCNGLAGGAFLNGPGNAVALLSECERLLAPGGCLFLANTFHDGRQGAVQLFADTARERGWECAGSWQDLRLVPPGTRV